MQKQQQFIDNVKQKCREDKVEVMKVENQLKFLKHDNELYDISGISIFRLLKGWCFWKAFNYLLKFLGLEGSILAYKTYVTRSNHRAPSSSTRKDI